MNHGPQYLTQLSDNLAFHNATEESFIEAWNESRCFLEPEAVWNLAFAAANQKPKAFLLVISREDSMLGYAASWVLATSHREEYKDKDTLTLLIEAARQNAGKLNHIVLNIFEFCSASFSAAHFDAVIEAELVPLELARARKDFTQGLSNYNDNSWNLAARALEAGYRNVYQELAFFCERRGLLKDALEAWQCRLEDWPDNRNLLNKCMVLSYRLALLASQPEERKAYLATATEYAADIENDSERYDALNHMAALYVTGKLDNDFNEPKLALIPKGSKPSSCFAAFELIKRRREQEVEIQQLKKKMRLS